MSHILHTLSRINDCETRQPTLSIDIVLTRKGHRRLWDGRHWRVLCRISYCTAQRQGSLYNKFGLCKKHFTQIELNKFQPITPLSYKSSHLPSNIEENKITWKRWNLNQLRRSQAISQLCHVDF